MKKIMLSLVAALAGFFGVAENVITLGPDAATADYTDFATAFEAAPADGTSTTVRLVGDVTTKSIYTILDGQNITLDLNDCRLYLQATGGSNVGTPRITINAGGQLTMMDGSKSGKGQLAFENKEGVGIDIQGTFTLASGTIRYEYWKAKEALSVSGTFNMTGGVLTSGCNQNCCIYINGSGRVTISGGTIDDALVKSSDKNVNPIIALGSTSASCFITATDAPVKIHHGKGNAALNTNNNGGNIFVTGKNVHVTGKLTVNNSNGKLELSGGTYSVNPSAYLASGYRSIEYTDETGTRYRVVPTPTVSIAREVAGTENWTVEDSSIEWGEGVTAPGDGAGVTLTTTDAATMALDGEAIKLNELTIAGEGGLIWTGSGTLTSTVTRVSADTDFSDISGAVDLGYLIIDDGVTVTLDSKTTYERLETTGNIVNPMPCWRPEQGSDFATIENWSNLAGSSEYPTSGDITIDLTRSTGDVNINVPSGSFGFSNIYVKGGNHVRFTGDGSIATTDAGTLNLVGDTKFVQTIGQIAPSVVVSAGSTLILEAAEGTTLTSTAVISGTGAVVTRGKVVMAAANTFTGGLTVKSGTISMSVKNGYGASGSRVTVLDGACADVNLTGNSNGYRFTIAGSGPDGTGVLTNSGSDFSNNATQLLEIKLSDDATIDMSKRWGLLNKSGDRYLSAVLDLGGKTLTKIGSGDFSLVGVTTPEGSRGTLRAEAGRIWIFFANSDFSGITLELAGKSKLRYERRVVTGFEAIKFLAGTSSDDGIGIENYGNGSLDAKSQWIMAGGTWDTTTDGPTNDGGSVLTCPANEMSVMAASTIKIGNGKTLTLSNTAIDGTGTLTFTATGTSGDATVDFGQKHPTASLAFGENVKIKMQLEEGKKTFDLTIPGIETDAQLAAFKSALTLTTATGGAVPTYNLSVVNGVVTVDANMSVWDKAGDNLDFTTAVNWSGGSEYPTSGNLIFQVSAEETANVNIPADVSQNTYDSVTVTGGGAVAFTGAGSLKTKAVYVEENSTLTQSGQLATTTAEGALTVDLKATTSTYVLEAAEGTTLTSTATISGTGAVITRGDVVMAAANTFTGGLTAKSGFLKLTHDWGFGGSGGGYVDNAVTVEARVTVEKGACVDLGKDPALDASYRFTIAGQGVALKDDDGKTIWSGAIRNTGNLIGSESRQTVEIKLTDDALIVVESGHDWGLLAPRYGDTYLDLGGHTLTKRGEGRFWVSTTTANSSGTIRVQEGVFFPCRSKNGIGKVNLKGVRLSLEDNATLAIELQEAGIKDKTKALAGLSGIEFHAAKDGALRAYGMKYIDSAIPLTVDISGFASEDLTLGETMTLVTRSSSSHGNLTDRKWTVLGGRFSDTSVAAGEITATVGELRNLWHYDFDKGAVNDRTSEESALAAGSFTRLGDWENVTETPRTIATALGRAVLTSTGFAPSWTTNDGGRAPFAACTLTATIAVKATANAAETVWRFGAADNNHVKLLQKDPGLSLAIVTNGVTTTLVTLPGQTLKGSYHFVSAVFTMNETRLQLDGKDSAVGAAIPFEMIPNIGQVGALGAGYWVDDWRVFDAELTAEELAAVRKSVLVLPFRIIIR